jgi:hypothetical protein
VPSSLSAVSGRDRSYQRLGPDDVHDRVRIMGQAESYLGDHHRRMACGFLRRRQDCKRPNRNALRRLLARMRKALSDLLRLAIFVCYGRKPGDWSSRCPATPPSIIGLCGVGVLICQSVRLGTAPLGGQIPPSPRPAVQSSRVSMGTALHANITMTGCYWNHCPASILTR